MRNTDQYAIDNNLRRRQALYQEPDRSAHIWIDAAKMADIRAGFEFENIPDNAEKH